jgi:hypothetical protein
VLAPTPAAPAGAPSAGGIALGVVNVDESGAKRVDQTVIDALSAISAIRDARLIRV